MLLDIWQLQQELITARGPTHQEQQDGGLFCQVDFQGAHPDVDLLLDSCWLNTAICCAGADREQQGASGEEPTHSQGDDPGHQGAAH